jgi:RNA polymerase sigma-70 factor (ECF subfamily)
MDVNFTAIVMPQAFYTSQYVQLFNEHNEWLRNCAVKITKDREVARDVVQDFFAYYWSNRESITITSSFKSYATRAVQYIAMSYVKKGKIRELHYARLPVEESEESFATATSEKEYDIRSASLLAAIDELPEQRKKILLMHQFGKMKYTEIANALGLSKNTVKTHLRLAYKTLKEKSYAVIMFSVLMNECHFSIFLNQ